WLFDIDTLTNSMNYVPVVVAGTSSTNISGTKDAAIQVESSIPLLLQKNSPADQMETLTVEFAIPTEELKKISDALKDPCWVEAMQEELLQFKIQNVWILVDCPKGVRPIGTKWVLKNKKDERGIMIRNKARLVAQGHTHEEGIDYKEVARIEAIRLFLAYASFLRFTVYQMHVKSVFLYGTIDEEVYVMQPPGFQDTQFLDRVYKVEKAMYGLHQAPRAWYGTLSKYLLANGFQRGTIDQTLFIRKHRGDFLLVQLYVDDIIFGLSNPQLYREFKALMHEKFQMSAMGELNFFLGLQVLQKKYDIFLSQDKYVGDILKKFRYTDVRYLKGHPKLGLWYPKESPFDLVAYSDSDYGGATQDKKSTTGGCQFLGRRLISWQCKKQTIVATSTTEAEYVAAASGCGQVLWIQNQLLDYWVYNFSKMIINGMVRNINNKGLKFLMYPRQYSRKATWIAQSRTLPTAADEPAFLLRDGSQGEAFLTVSSLDAGHDRKNIIKTFALPHDSTLMVTSLDADEGNMQQKLQELIDLCTGLQRQQTEMATKIEAQDLEISGLKAMIKLLKDKDKGSAELSGDDAPIKGRKLVNVLTSMDAANILTSGVQDVSFPPVAKVSTVGVPTVSGLVPTVSAIFTTASVVTPYSRRPKEISAKDKGKEKVVEFDTPKKKKLQEQIDVQVAREMEEEMAKDNQRINERIARDAEIARIHAEEELKMMIDGLDRSNEIIAKHL
nr:putative ribonuclease H-like domain-containing protein [Tanacetum cinerariifolium]